MKETKGKFELLTEIASNLSMQFDGVDTEFRKGKVSTYYLAKLVHSCWSLNKLLPSSDEDFFDFSSIASICRNIIELTNLCWYHCFDITDDLEAEFRFLLYDLHDTTALMSIFDNLSIEIDDIENLQKEKERVKQSITDHPKFKTLTPSEKKEVKKGRKSTLLNQSQIIESRNINSNEFRGVYKLLSTHTHSTATSLNQLTYKSLHSQDMDHALLELSMFYTSSFIAEMIRNIGCVWSIEFAKLESEEFINTLANQLYIDMS